MKMTSEDHFGVGRRGGAFQDLVLCNRKFNLLEKKALLKGSASV
jgi:hypothetical protein